MTLVKKTTLMMATALLPFSAYLSAAESAPQQIRTSLSQSGGEVGCHRLMTERECTAFLTTLASLPAGEGRDRFLADHFALKREREAACSTSRTNADRVIFYPRVEQVARGS